MNTHTKRTFDFETFNKHKDNTNIYYFITEDSTVIEQEESYNEYTEIIKLKDSYFEILNSYYKSNGKLKSTIERFPNHFLKGTWKKYDEQGNLIEETDYDKPYTFTFEQVLAWIKKKEIDMTGYDFHIARAVLDRGPIWDIRWEKKDKSGLRRAFINGTTGIVEKEFDEDYPEEE